jgi:N-acetylglutamate synthase-like GNAT family acetyltransferase
MNIREAISADIPALSALLEQLGYPAMASAIAERLTQFSQASMSAVFVYEVGGRAVGVIVLHLVPQLIFDGDVVLISCLVVDRIFWDTGIGAELEEFACSMARKDQAVQIALHCNDNRSEALRFYLRQGYLVSKNYLTKTL